MNTGYGDLVNEMGNLNIVEIHIAMYGRQAEKWAGRRRSWDWICAPKYTAESSEKSREEETRNDE
jgi:hypothetical protein